MSNTHTAEPGMLSQAEERPGQEGETTFVRVYACMLRISAPVGRCGEQTQDDVASLHVYDVACGVQKVEIEVRVSWDGAVEASLQKCGPLFLEDTLRAPQVGLTHTRHARHHHLKEKVHGALMTV